MKKPMGRPRLIENAVSVTLSLPAALVRWYDEQPGTRAHNMRWALMDRWTRQENPQFATISMDGKDEEIVEVIRARQ